MNRITIVKRQPQLPRLIANTASIFLIIHSGIAIFSRIPNADKHDLWFYFSCITLLIGVLCLIIFSIKNDKVVLTASIDGFFPKLSSSNGSKSVLWDEVEQVIIGLNFIEVVLKTNKTLSYDLGELQYNDLKDVKSTIVEICETKNISYRNA